MGRPYPLERRLAETAFHFVRRLVMPPRSPKGERLRMVVALAVMLAGFAVTGCDLDVRARANVPLGDSHTVHISYRSGAPSGGREASRP